VNTPYPIVRSGLNDQIYERLRDRILAGDPAPGTRIHIDSLCRDYSVSRTPVKDALRLLQGDGLVDLRPRSGTFVRQPTAQDLIEVFGLRQVLEEYAAEGVIRNITSQETALLRRLVGRGGRVIARAHVLDAWREFLLIDQRFHDLLITAADNRHLLDLYRRLKAHNLVALVRFPDTPARMKRAHADHLEILEATKRRDLKGYLGAIRGHLENAQTNLLRHLSKVEGRPER